MVKQSKNNFRLLHPWRWDRYVVPKCPLHNIPKQCRWQSTHCASYLSLCPFRGPDISACFLCRSSDYAFPYVNQNTFGLILLKLHKQFNHWIPFLIHILNSYTITNKNVQHKLLRWSSSWSSGQSFWLLIMRSRVRFPASLKGKIPMVTIVWVI
jgi:hypothetical protein